MNSQELKVLLVGGAGMVGSIIRSALEMEHDVWVYDRARVPEAVHPSIVADVDDETAVRAALAGMDAVVYVAMGVDGMSHSVNRSDLAFNINTRGIYTFLRAGIEAGIKRFVYASTFDVYGRYFYERRLVRNEVTREYEPGPLTNTPPLDEDSPLDAWGPYAISKRLAEDVCRAAAERYPDTVITALRLVTPRDEANYPAARRHAEQYGIAATGPNDLRSLFVAAVNNDKTGLHILQASSDVEGKSLSNRKAFEVLGWKPQGD